nr:hypothetical protein L204_03361 [Cryptococcus depauperatus CBS 7855]
MPSSPPLPPYFAEEHDTPYRMSMYVTLLKEMMSTVLAEEDYLFTSQELWVLDYIMSLQCMLLVFDLLQLIIKFIDEPLYLLTRLLLRRPGRVHTLSSLLEAYSEDIGEHGVKDAMKMLLESLNLPREVIEPINAASTPSKVAAELSFPTTPNLPFHPPYISASTSDSELRRMKAKKPWSDISSGLSPEEERADPDLAEALKESFWAAKVRRIDVGDEDHENLDRQDRMIPAKTSCFLPQFSLTPILSPPISSLAIPSTSLTLSTLLSAIPLDDLRRLAKSRKIPASSLSNRKSMEKALLSLAKRQSVLTFSPTKNSNSLSKDRPILQTAASRMTMQSPDQEECRSSESLLISAVLSILGPALVINPALQILINRVNLVFSRVPPTADNNTSLMLPAILATSHKRPYPMYTPQRTRVWKSRAALLLWERAIGWEGVIEAAMGDWEQKKNAGDGVRPGTMFGSQNETILGEGMWINRRDGATIVKTIWQNVWPIWLQMVKNEHPRDDKAFEKQGEKGQQDVEKRISRQLGGVLGDRFEIGHVLTRIVYKGAEALGVLHEYDMECTVLRALLKQKRWRKGKRGAWYDRLALVLMTHYKNSPCLSIREKEEKLREATQVCIDGLLDDDTHLIYRPGLSRRLTRLENKLKLPADERHISYASLLKSETREVTAIRLPENRGQTHIALPSGETRSRSLSGRSDRKRSRSNSILESREEKGFKMKNKDGENWQGQEKLVGKSLWMGKVGEVGVEEWVLEWWAKKGYKGYHSESSILTTFFTLLLWPIIFHPLPGSFQTPHQTAPLDLGEDTFSFYRRDLLEERLAFISSKTSNALELLRETDERERKRGTWAVGVNWRFEKQDLEEILECVGGRAMSGICRMLAEEYKYRASGVPDLIVWNKEKNDVRFVEVKGPGDNLSETQKIWVDVLLSLGIPVEVCRVKACLPSSKQLSDFYAKQKKRRAATINMTETSDEESEIKKAKTGYGMTIEDDWTDIDSRREWNSAERGANGENE